MTTPTGDPTTVTGAIPGLGGLTGAASGNIMQLLSGLPSVSATRTANAYNSVGQGQPATQGTGGFSSVQGQNLYGQQAQQNQQTGLGDLLSLVGGYSGTVAPSAGEVLQDNQFGQQLQQGASEFNATNSLNYLNTILSQLGRL